MLFDELGQMAGRASVTHRQFYPQKGFVEHDGQEIYENTLKAMHTCVHDSGVSESELAAIAITNQRETALVWERSTGVPIRNAAVWQCLRGEKICRELSVKGHGKLIKDQTGLLLDPYFSASKIKWIIDNTDGAREKGEAGALAFGTIDTWLVWKLTDGNVHVTDYSNACRTMLFDITRLEWSLELLDLFGIPPSMAPSLTFSDAVVGRTRKGEPFDIEVPIGGLMGDSHAALFGEGCFRRGSVKATYGTGSSIMMNVGEEPLTSKRGIVTSIGFGMSSGITYAFEGNIHSSGGTIQWLVEDLGLIKDAGESSSLARSVDSTSGVYLVPAFVGLGAPYWDNDARATVSGISRATSKAHVVRAAEESIAYQVCDLLEVMREEASVELTELNVDGGATRDEFLMQFQADILDIPVQCAEIEEVSALGAAYAAGLAIGLWSNVDDLAAPHAGKRYVPRMRADERRRLYSGWKEAIGRTLWKDAAKETTL